MVGTDYVIQRIFMTSGELGSYRVYGIPLTTLVPEGSSFSTIKWLKKILFQKLSLVKYLCESEREKKKMHCIMPLS